MATHGTHQPDNGGEESVPIERFVVLFVLLAIFGVAIVIQSAGRDNVSTGPTADSAAFITTAALPTSALAKPTVTSPAPKPAVPQQATEPSSTLLLPAAPPTVNAAVVKTAPPAVTSAPAPATAAPTSDYIYATQSAAPAVNPMPDPMPKVDPMPTFDLLPNVNPMPNVDPLP